MRNPGSPKLFCLEISRVRFAELQARYADKPFVYCYNYSTLSADEFPSAAEIEAFFKTHPGAFGIHSLDQVLSWWRADRLYAARHPDRVGGIEAIRSEHGIQLFDLVLIDGSEFAGAKELDKVIGARYIFLDDVKTFKCHTARQRLIADARYRLVCEDLNLRNGFSLFERVVW